MASAPESQAAHDYRRSVGIGKGLHYAPAPLFSIRRNVPGAHHGNAGPHLKNSRQRPSALDVQPQRAVRAFTQKRGVVFFVHADEAFSFRGKFFQFGGALIQNLLAYVLARHSK